MCTVHGSSGSRDITLKGDMRGIGEVWVDPDGLANVLSLEKVKNTYRVTYDSWGGNKFVVNKPDGNNIIFIQSKHGLYYHDIKSRKISSSNNKYSFMNAAKTTMPDACATTSLIVTTVANNALHYTARQLRYANQARRLYAMVRYPSVKDFRGILTCNFLRNCPVSIDDIDRADKIFGKESPPFKARRFDLSLPQYKPTSSQSHRKSSPNTTT